jgi:hypothetical protein
MLYIHTVLSLYKMGRKKENILTREPTRIYPSYQSGNQFGRFGTNLDTPNYKAAN